MDSTAQKIKKKKRYIFVLKLNFQTLQDKLHKNWIAQLQHINKHFIFASVFTSLILCNKGSSQPTLHSQWLSKNVNTLAVAASAPRTRDLIRPDIKMYNFETGSFTVHYTQWMPTFSSVIAEQANFRKRQQHWTITGYIQTKYLKLIKNHLSYKWKHIFL